MIEFSDSEIEAFEGNINYIYEEGSVTINGNFGNDIFSRTHKFGMGMNVVEHLPLQKNIDFLRLQIHNTLTKRMDNSRKYKLEK
jgi:hypothetical protein